MCVCGVGNVLGCGQAAASKVECASARSQTVRARPPRPELSSDNAHDDDEDEEEEDEDDEDDKGTEEEPVAGNGQPRAKLRMPWH